MAKKETVAASGSFDDLREAMGRFLHLSVGWDSYDAPPPSMAAYRAVQDFLSVCELEEALPGRVAASAVGGIGISFCGEDCRAYFEFRNNGEGAVIFSRDSSEGLIVFRFETAADQGVAIGMAKAWTR